MAQFDVHRNLGTTRAEFPYFVILQSSLFQGSRRRVVIPLTRTTARLPQAERLNPVFEIEGQIFSLMTLATLSLPKDRLDDEPGLRLGFHGRRRAFRRK
jgi:toxin CcdB